MKDIFESNLYLVSSGILALVMSLLLGYVLRDRGAQRRIAALTLDVNGLRRHSDELEEVNANLQEQLRRKDQEVTGQKNPEGVAASVPATPPSSEPRGLVGILTAFAGVLVAVSGVVAAASSFKSTELTEKTLALKAANEKVDELVNQVKTLSTSYKQNFGYPEPQWTNLNQSSLDPIKGGKGVVEQLDYKMSAGKCERRDIALVYRGMGPAGLLCSAGKVQLTIEKPTKVLLIKQPERADPRGASL